MAQPPDPKTPKLGRNAGKTRDDSTGAWLGGEFYDPSAQRSLPRETVQKQFLLVATELYGVTADLRDNVLPHFVRLGAPAAEEALVEALKNWTRQYHLGQPWVLKQVKDTLTLWALDPYFARPDLTNPPWHPLFDFVIRRPWPATTEPFAFTFVAANSELTTEGTKTWSEPAGWYLELDRREVFENDARRQFEVALKEYVADQEKKAEGRGLVRVTRSRASKFTPRSKMQWAVHRNCGAKTFEQIADIHLQTNGQVADISTIIKSVTEISQLIELDRPRL
jgi:hypothetical protein